MSISYYDREGNLLELDEYARLMSQAEYVRVKKTEGPGWFVSTVWLGLDHDFTGKGPPLIFETMLFYTDGGKIHSNDSMMTRAATENEALANHHEMVEQVRDALGSAPNPWPGVMAIAVVAMVIAWIAWLVLR